MYVSRGNFVEEEEEEIPGYRQDRYSLQGSGELHLEESVGVPTYLPCTLPYTSLTK